MTLVLSDLSRHGIIMLGDNAVVRRSGVVAVGNVGKAEKVQYLPNAKIGAAIWGIRSIGGTNSDEVLAEYISRHDSADLELETCGLELAELFNALMEKAGLPSEKRKGGIHLGGYLGDNPKLWHIHWSATGIDGPWALGKDFPESQGINEVEFLKDIRSGRACAQIANGFHRILNMARDACRCFSWMLHEHEGLAFPHDSIDGQVRYVRTLHSLVSAALFSPGDPVYVSEDQKLIAFDRNGIIKGPIYFSTHEEIDQTHKPEASV